MGHEGFSEQDCAKLWSIKGGKLNEIILMSGVGGGYSDK